MKTLMHSKLQIAHFMMLLIYSALLTSFAASSPSYGIMAFVVFACILYWSYFLLAFIFYMKKNLPNHTIIRAIRLNLTINVIFFVMYFIIEPLLMIAAATFPSINRDIDKFMQGGDKFFGIIFLIALIILIVTNLVSLTIFVKGLNKSKGKLSLN